MTWFADIRVKVEAEGGGPVEDVTVKVGHLLTNAIDGNYPMGFVTAQTDEYGEATLEIRVQDRDWNSKTQHFRVEVEKTSTRDDQTTLSHVFSPASEVVAVRHLGEPTIEFTDTTSVVISGTVSHAGFHAAYFTEGCPHTKFQYLADSFAVSGSTDQDGTYELNGMCESLPYYKCVGCSSGTKYIWYYPSDQRWYIGSGGCGSASAEIRVADTNADLEAVSGSWEEWDGSKFASQAAISVTTVKYFVVSGSTNHASAHGTYRQLGECSSVASYKCDDCGGDQYIWYDTTTTKWYIGSINCGTSSAGISVTYASEDLAAVPEETWYEGSNLNRAISVTALTSYTKVDTEECICPVDGVEVWIKRESGPKKVTVNEGKFSTAVFEGEVVTLYLKGYYGVTGSSDCDGAAAPKDQSPDDQNLGNLHCIEFTDAHGVKQLADVLEVKTDTDGDGTCSCPEGYEIWVPRSYEHANAVYTDTNVPADYKVGGIEGVAIGGIDSTTNNYGYSPPTSCSKYLCSRAGLHQFSVTHDAGGATVQKGVWPSFDYTATEDAEVHFLDTSTQTLSSKLVAGAGGDTATYVSGLPIVASVERCGWELPAWTLRGVANFELGAAAVKVRTLGADEVDEVKYYYPYGDLSNTDQEFVVRDCNATERADMVGVVESVASCSDGGSCSVNGQVCRLNKDSVGSSYDYCCVSGTWTAWTAAACPDTMLRGCRAKIPDVSTSDPDRLPCATTKYTYVDELPAIRNFEKDLSYLTNAAASVNFEITSPLCLKSVTATGTGLKYLVNEAGKTRETDYGSFSSGSAESLLLLSKLPEPQEEGDYGKACTTNTGAVFREGDVVNLEFTLKEREPQCTAVKGEVYPWDDCEIIPLDVSPTTSQDIKIRVADGVSGIEASGDYPDEGKDTFTHTMTVGEPNPFAPFSHELSVEFTRAYDDAKILFVRHVLVLGSIPEEVPQVWTVATNPTLIFSIIRDPPGGASTATLVEGSTISTSMAIDGSHAAQLEDSFNAGFSLGGGLKTEGGVGIGAFVMKNIASVGGEAGFSYAQTPTDVTVSRSSSRHFDIGISFGVGISTSDSPYIAGQPSDVIIGGGANLRFISEIEIYATETPNSDPKELCLGGLTALAFLPEQISTWVMSVYEIEKTIERIGAALTDPNTKMENKNESSKYDPRADLEKQIENWRTVLENYRAATIRDQAESVAEQLSNELNGIHANFESFLKEATTGINHQDQSSGYSDFLRHGLWKLAEYKLIYHRKFENSGVPGWDAATREAQSREDVIVGDGANYRLNDYENDVLDRVNKAFTDCVSSATLVEPGGPARLCDVYLNISAKLELKKSLFGICDFAKEDTGPPKEKNTKGEPGKDCCPLDKSYCTGDSDKDARARVLENLKFFARLRESRRACPEG